MIKKQTHSLFHSGLELASMLIIAFVVVGSLLLVLNVYLATPSPQVAVTTTSMEPVYGGYIKPNLQIVPLDGDVLIIKNQIPSLGDVIVYKSINPEYASTPIVHRVIAIQRDPAHNNSLLFLTQGDNNAYTDVQARISSTNGTWVEQTNVVGVVIFRIPWIGWLSLQIQNLNLRIFLFLALGIVLVLMFKEDTEAEDINQEVNNDTTKKTDTHHSGTNTRVRSLLSRIKYALIKNSSFKAWVLHTGTGNVVVTAIIILLCASIFGIGLYSTGPNTIQLYTPGNTLWDPNTTVTISTTQTLNLNMETYHNINGTGETLYLIHTRLSLDSHGLFNWIEQIDLHINQTSQSPVYVWDITYAYNGNFMINTSFLLYINSTLKTGSYHEDLVYTVISAGLLAQPAHNYEYSCIFQL